MKKTIVINLLGGPGVGKSTFANKLISEMKTRGISCEYVEEFAKGLVWENRAFALQDQSYILANQNHNLLRVRGKVKVIVTDSPLLLSMYYNRMVTPEYKISDNVFDNYILELYNQYDNWNLLLNRDFPYVQEGRYQNEEESIQVGKDIKKILQDKKIDFEEIYPHDSKIQEIVDVVELTDELFYDDDKDLKHEYERRFLLKNEEILKFGLAGKKISQTYLKFGGTEKRVRVVDEKKYYFTEKKGTGDDRQEYEVEITEEQYNNLVEKLGNGQTVEKERYSIPLKGAKKCDINVFRTPKDIKMVEVEFENKKDMKKFVPPQWFGAEVTNDKNYNSANIQSE